MQSRTWSHVRCESGNISEAMQERKVVTAETLAGPMVYRTGPFPMTMNVLYGHSLTVV